MRWNVEGADAQTGRDRLVTVEADNPGAAEALARAKGMLIAAVHPVKVLSPADKLEQMMAGTLDASTVTTPGPVEWLAAEWITRVTDHFVTRQRDANAEDDS